MSTPLRYQFRHYLVIGVIGVIFTGIIVRAGYLTIVDKDFLQAQGDARVMREEPIIAMRGVIRDRNQIPLAVSTPVTTLTLDPRLALSSNTDLGQLAKALGISEGELRRKVHANRTKGFMYLRRQLPPEEAKAILAQGFRGVSSLTEYKRFYPEAEVAAQVLGFTGADDQGREGLELAYESQLRGVPGKKRVIKNLKGQHVQDVSLIKAASPGHDVVLSFDSRVQYAAYRELARGVMEHEADSGTLVSLDVRTGEVLAMASYPSFNPNNRKNLDISHVRNRAVTDMFEPGSTMKVLTVAAALESGKYSTSSRFDTNPGTYKVYNKVIRDHNNYGVIDMPMVIAKSSNVATAQIALSLPKSTLPELFRRVGFGASTHSGFPGESAGVLQPPSRWNPVEVATMSYGYGVTVTALQLAHAYATIASGGIMRPVSFTRVEEPVAGERVLKESVAHALLPMMESAVTREGTALRADVPGYRVGGKTGTAHKAQAGGYAHDKYMSLFVGVAPISDPRVVTAVIIDNPRKGGYYGGLAAAPVFARSMADALRLMNVEPDRSSERLAAERVLPAQQLTRQGG